jgi:hypothetical protein
VGAVRQVDGHVVVEAVEGGEEGPARRHRRTPRVFVNRSARAGTMSKARTVSIVSRVRPGREHAGVGDVAGADDPEADARHRRLTRQ